MEQPHNHTIEERLAVIERDLEFLRSTNTNPTSPWNQEKLQKEQEVRNALGKRKPVIT